MDESTQVGGHILNFISFPREAADTAYINQKEKNHLFIMQ